MRIVGAIVQVAGRDADQPPMESVTVVVVILVVFAFGLGIGLLKNHITTVLNRRDR